MPWIKWLGAYRFCPVRLFVLLLSTFTFAKTFEPWEIEASYLTYIYTYSTYDALSNETKDNDLVTLTLSLGLKIAFSDFLAAGCIVFHKRMYFLFSRS